MRIFNLNESASQPTCSMKCNNTLFVSPQELNKKILSSRPERDTVCVCARVRSVTRSLTHLASLHTTTLAYFQTTLLDLKPPFFLY